MSDTLTVRILGNGDYFFVVDAEGRFIDFSVPSVFGELRKSEDFIQRQNGRLAAEMPQDGREGPAQSKGGKS